MQDPKLEIISLEGESKLTVFCRAPEVGNRTNSTHAQGNKYKTNIFTEVCENIWKRKIHYRRKYRNKTDEYPTIM